VNATKTKRFNVHAAPALVAAAPLSLRHHGIQEGQDGSNMECRRQSVEQQWTRPK